MDAAPLRRTPQGNDFMDEEDFLRWARLLLTALDRGGSLSPVTDSEPLLSIADGYRISERLMRLRHARGERVVGWKIGFTNRTIWDQYGVHAPIWGPMYDSTSMDASQSTELPIAHLHEPRIEPEIAFRLSRVPDPEMDDRELLTCIDAVSHGVEIVYSPFTKWRFRPADTVAAGALHGSFVHGKWVPIERVDHSRWVRELADFSIELTSDDGVSDVGHARNVLDGPLSALRHFVAGLAAFPLGRFVEIGDIVTTGTVTRAFPVEVNQIWKTTVEGLPLQGLHIRCV